MVRICSQTDHVRVRPAAHEGPIPYIDLEFMIYPLIHNAFSATLHKQQFVLIQMSDDDADDAETAMSVREMLKQEQKLLMASAKAFPKKIAFPTQAGDAIGFIMGLDHHWKRNSSTTGRMRFLIMKGNTKVIPMGIYTRMKTRCEPCVTLRFWRIRTLRVRTWEWNPRTSTT